MKKFLEKLDQKYLKICLYAAVAVILTVCATAIMLSTGPFWKKLWSIFSAVIKPIIIGGILCYLFMPIANKIEGFLNKNGEHKGARKLSVLLTYLLVFFIIGCLIVLVAVTVYKNIEAVNVDSIREMFFYMKDNYAEVWAFAEDKLASLNIPTDKLTGIISVLTESVKNFFSGMLFGVIFSVYFMLDTGRITKYWGRIINIFVTDESQDKVESFMKDADNAFSGYIRGQFTDALIVGILVTVTLSLAGIPYATIVGVLAGVGNMIPYLGPVVGYVTLIIVCLPSGAMDKLIIGAVIMAVVMFVDGNIINPRLLSNSVDVHPLLVVAALIGGGAIGGIVGMLVAVPVAALVKLQFERYVDKVEAKKLETLEENEEDKPEQVEGSKN